MENGLDSYTSARPEGLNLVHYSTIPGGTLFKRSFLILNSEEGEMEFRLIHNNYANAGRLDKETYGKYLATLEKVFTENLKIRK